MGALERWNKEYSTVNAIPSSIRDKPSHGLIKVFKETIISSNINNILDLGCGNGRNSIYLKENGFDVTAIDYSEEALKLFKDKINSNEIKVNRENILDGLPYKDTSFDCVLDSYFHCHFVNVNEWENILNDVYRVLKDGGIFISIQLSTNDKYYKDNKIKEVDAGFISHDPKNNFKKIHYSSQKYINLLNKFGFSAKNHSIEFEDKVLDTCYNRNVNIFCAIKK